MSITAGDHDTLAMAEEFKLLQAELARAIEGSGASLSREQLVAAVAEALGRWDGDVRLALKRMAVVEDEGSQAIRLTSA